MSAGSALATAPELRSAASYAQRLAALGPASSPAGWTGSILASQVAKELNGSLRGGQIPSQKATSLCGPAAFFYCLLRDRPDLFARAAYELWTRGQTTIGRLALQPSAKALTSWGGETDRFLDWMLLGSLRSSGGRAGMPFQGSYDSPREQYDAITTPNLLARWFTSAGAAVIGRDDRPWVRAPNALRLAAGPLNLIPLPRIGPSLADRLIALNRARAGGWVPLFINAGLLKQAFGFGDRAVGSLSANHWVVLNPTAPILLRERRGAGGVVTPLAALKADQDAIGGTPIDRAIIDLSVVTWGDERYEISGEMTVSGFFQYYYGCLTVAHFA